MQFVPVLPRFPAHRPACGPKRAHERLGRIHTSQPVGAGQFFQVPLDQRVQGRVLLFGNPRQLGVQAVAVLAVMAFSALATAGILELIALFTALRVSVREEGLGLDLTQHGEEAYARDEGAILVLPREAAADALPAAAAPQLAGGRA